MRQARHEPTTTRAVRLSQTAMEKNRPDGAIRMLDLASKQFPLDPYLKLRKAETAIVMGHGHAASKDLDELAELKWSPVYSAEIPDYISKLKNEIKRTDEKNKERDTPKGAKK